MPLPKSYEPSYNLDFFEINKDNFTIRISEHTEIASCGMIQRAVNRYLQNNYLFDDTKFDDQQQAPGIGSQAWYAMRNLRTRKSNYLNELVIVPQRKFSCENLPSDDMDEDYKMVIGFEKPAKNPLAILTARTNWGIIRGLETFSQLIYNINSPSHNQSQPTYAVRLAKIEDSPRYKFRGFMLDTARHYIPVSLIEKNLDAMASVKLNVFHWHLVDDQSFPLKLSSFPVLAEKGAFRPNMIYTKDDVQNIIMYAADRGIRVIPEFDSPGHTYSLKSLTPRVLTKCYNTTTQMPNGEFGPIDPTSAASHKFMAKIIAEFRQMFPDSYFHAGGDEVDLDCWKSNPDITRWMKQSNNTDYNILSSWYMRILYDMFLENNRTMIVWEEAFNNYIMHNPLPKDVIVQVWKNSHSPEMYKARLDTVVTAGHRALLSACWYLNLIEYGKDWPRFYNCDPLDTPGDNPRKQELIIGGEACHWTEYSDETNFLSRVWPRLAPVAERLWSQEHVKSVHDFTPRLEQLRCRLRFRGIDAEPINGPGFC